MVDWVQNTNELTSPVSMHFDVLRINLFKTIIEAVPKGEGRGGRNLQCRPPKAWISDNLSAYCSFTACSRVQSSRKITSNQFAVSHCYKIFLCTSRSRQRLFLVKPFYSREISNTIGRRRLHRTTEFYLLG